MSKAMLDAELMSVRRDLPFIDGEDKSKVDKLIKLIDAGADIEATDGVGRTLLMFSLMEGQRNFKYFIEYLVSKNADLNVLTREGDSILSLVHDEGLMNMFLDRGVRVRSVIPLFMAIVYNFSLATFTRLLDMGGDEFINNKRFGESLLARAVRSNRIDLVNLLLERGIIDKDEALLASCTSYHPNLARRLLNAGANKNTRTGGNYRTRTLLMKTASPGVAALLLGRGANVTLRNSRGVSAASHFLSKGFNPGEITSRMAYESWLRRRAPVLARAKLAGTGSGAGSPGPSNTRKQRRQNIRNKTRR